MSVVNYDSGNQGGNFDVAVPANAFNVRVYAAGGSGGGGGSDSGGSGGGGGNGRYGAFALQNYVARTLACRPGGAGPGGPGCFGRGTGPSSGSISGGGGGSASGCSGSGGGGGGGSGVYCNIYGWIICAGGGGGGGGGSWNRGGSGGGTAGGWGGGGGFGVGGGSNGNNATCGDGAGGGGGGGGAGGGGGGGGGCDNQNGGSGGGGGGSRYYSSGSVASLLSQSEHGGGGYVRVTFTSVTPEIFSFTASPSLQDSGTDGTPNYNTTLNWSAIDYTSLTLTSSAGESWDVANTSSRTITNLPQSVAGSNSPSSRTYTLTACYQSICTSSTITVEAKNDNTPSNSWTTEFTNLEPGTEYPKLLGTLSNIDMVTKVSCPTSGVFFSTGANGSYANPQYFTNGQSVYIKMTTLPFNTDLSGLSSNAEFGKSNPKTVSVTVGSLSAFNVTFTTRAPTIKETFDFDGEPGKYPYEDIDLINNTPNEFAVSQTLNMDDIEIDMEIKSDNPDIEIKIGNGSWQSVREI